MIETTRKHTVLDEAAAVTSGDRNKDYGTPLANHSTTAAMWSAYLNQRFKPAKIALDPEDVCWLNILQKVSRAAHAAKRDNVVDVAGYARNIEMVQEERASLADETDISKEIDHF